MLFFPMGEEMEGLIVSQISFEMEETIDTLLTGRYHRPFMATGKHSNRMTPFFQTFRHFVAPLGVAAWAGWGKEVREKEDSHLERLQPGSRS